MFYVIRARTDEVVPGKYANRSIEIKCSTMENIIAILKTTGVFVLWLSVLTVILFLSAHLFSRVCGFDCEKEGSYSLKNENLIPLFSFVLLFYFILTTVGFFYLITRV